MSKSECIQSYHYKLSFYYVSEGSNAGDCIETAQPETSQEVSIHLVENASSSAMLFLFTWDWNLILGEAVFYLKLN